MAETFEYAYLTIIDVSELKAQGRREWVGILQAGPGITIYEDGESALTVMNQLGNEGWMINDAHRQIVENNDLPGWLALLLREKFGRFGIVHSRATHFLTRRLNW